MAMRTAPTHGISRGGDPEANVRGGVRFLRFLHDRYKNPFFILAAYNAGEEAVQKSRGVPPYPETVRFVALRLALMGRQLRSGEFVIAGSLTPIVPVAAGDEVRADFGPLGTLAVEFTD